MHGAGVRRSTPRRGSYSVAEFAWTPAMAVNHRIVRAATRTRDFDFRHATARLGRRREPGLCGPRHDLRSQGTAPRQVRPGHPARPDAAGHPAAHRGRRPEDDEGRRDPHQLQPRRPDRHRGPRRRTARGPLCGRGPGRLRGGDGPVLPRQVPRGRRRRHPGPPGHLPERPGPLPPGVLHRGRRRPDHRRHRAERPRLHGRPPLRERARPAQPTHQLPYDSSPVERQHRLGVELDPGEAEPP